MDQSIENYISVVNNIKKITSSNNNYPNHNGKVNLISVSKTHNISKIKPLLDYGCRVFGENKVQEAIQKWSEVKNNYPDIELHLIGHLQTNKVSAAVELFNVIQTVDRQRLAEKISLEQNKQSKDIKCFIQVNTGDEKQKSGISIKEADDFIKYCIKDINLNIVGLMCIPPINEPAGLHFGLLRNIAKSNHIVNLSMGMSKDYELAVLMGATYVRIGSAIFGKREIKKN